MGGSDSWFIDSEEFGRLTADRKRLEGGTEHLVLLPVDVGRVLKVTKGPGYGLQGSLLQYIDNILLSNYLFGDDIRLEGVLPMEDRAVMVVSQPFIAGRSPTQEEVDDWFREQGYAPDGYLRWRNATLAVTITDAHTGNFIVVASGEMIPIDLQIIAASDEVRVRACELF